MRFKDKLKSGIESSEDLDVQRESKPLTWRRRVQRSKNLIESFSHALRGLELAFSAERNLKIHLACAVLAVILAAVLSFDVVSWTLLFLAIGLVFIAELLNTAVERVVDMVSGGEFHILAKEAKDIAAAAVVVASFTSLLMGAALFLPRLLPFVVRH